MDDDNKQVLLLQIRALGQLPSPSATALRLISLLQSDNVGFREVAAVVRGELTLTLRVLRLANRPGIGTVRPVLAVEEALQRLGMKATSQLATGLSVLDDALRHPGTDVAAYLMLCRQSLAAAVVCEWLSAQPGIPASSAEMFTCALLARVGQLALLRFYPQAYAALLETIRDPVTLVQEEQASFGVDHTAVGAALLTEWGFPVMLVQVINRARGILTEDDLEHDRHSIMAQVLRHSWELAPVLERNDGAELALGLRRVLASFGLERDQHQLTDVAASLLHEWEFWQSQQQLPAVPSSERTHRAPGKGTGQQPDHTESVPNAPVQVLFLAADQDRPEACAALQESGFSLIQHCSSLDQATQRFRIYQNSLLLAWFSLEQLDSNAVALTTLLADWGHAVLVLCDQVPEALQVDLMGRGMDAVLPTSIGTALLCAHVSRVAERIKLNRLLEHERDTHRHVLSQLVLTTRKLHHQALTDPLTGLSNRRMADAYLKRHWAQSERRGTSLSCMVLDLDDFKSINDTLGHEAGDRVLQSFGELLLRECRQEDLAVRMGGDEFMMICPMTSESSMRFLEQRLRVTAAQVTAEVGPIHFTAGIAERDPAGMNTPEALLLKADQRLLAAKRALHRKSGS